MPVNGISDDVIVAIIGQYNRALANLRRQQAEVERLTQELDKAACQLKLMHLEFQKVYGTDISGKPLSGQHRSDASSSVSEPTKEPTSASTRKLLLEISQMLVESSSEGVVTANDVFDHYRTHHPHDNPSLTVLDVNNIMHEMEELVHIELVPSTVGNFVGRYTLAAPNALLSRKDRCTSKIGKEWKQYETLVVEILQEAEEPLTFQALKSLLLTKGVPNRLFARCNFSHVIRRLLKEKRIARINKDQYSLPQ